MGKTTKGNSDKQKAHGNKWNKFFKTIKGAFFALLPFVVGSFINTFIEQVNIPIIGLAVISVVFVFIYLILIKRDDTQKERQIKNMEDIILYHERQGKLYDELVNLTINITKSKLTKKIERIGDENSTLNLHADSKGHLEGIVEKLKDSVHESLKTIGFDIAKGDLSISIAYLFDPPETIEKCFSKPHSKNWGWIKNNNLNARDVTTFRERDKVQSTLRHTMVDLKNVSYFANKGDAYRSFKYKPTRDDISSCDPHIPLKGSIYCSPITKDDDNKKQKSVVIAAINISTHTYSFTNDDKKNREVKKWLDFYTGSVENQIKTELFNLYTYEKKLNEGTVKDEQEQKTEENK